MDQNLVARIAATFTDVEPNPNVKITLPGAVVQFLINWSTVGQERADADPEPSALLGAIMAEVDRQVIGLNESFDRQVLGGDLAAAERIGGSVVNPKWTRMVAAFVKRHRAFHGSDWTHDDADGFLKWAKRTNSELFWFYTRDLGVPVP